MVEKKSKKSNSRRQYSIDIQKNKPQDANQKLFDNISFEIEFGIKSHYFEEFKQKFTYLKNNHSVDTKSDINTNIKKWRAFFSEIYHDEGIDFELYEKHCYLLLISKLSLEIINEKIVNYFQGSDDNKIAFDSKEKRKDKNFLFTAFSELNFLKSEFYSYIQTKNSEFRWLDDLEKQICKDLPKYFFLPNAENILGGDLFNLLYQELIFPGRRHKLGEFYTPIPLAKSMIDYSYSIGKIVLDPACGTGTFLIEIMKKIVEFTNSKNNSNSQNIYKYLTQIYGVEINPITSIVAKLNILQFILTSIFPIIKPLYSLDILSELHKILTNIISTDFLLDNENLDSIKNKKFDLIIGNPPWLVINGVHSINYKENLKNLARSMNIGTTTQNISNLELSSLFLAKSTIEFLAQNGIIFFITSAGLLTGTQNDRIREFHGLKNLRIWEFDKDLFNIHNICVYAEKGFQSSEQKYKIEVETKICSDNPIAIKEGKKEIYVPIYKKIKRNKSNSLTSQKNILFTQNTDEKGTNQEESVNLIGRFIPESKYRIYIANKKQFSTYRDRFRQGACIGPRNLLFCEDLSILNDKNCMKILDESPELFFLIKKILQYFIGDRNEDNNEGELLKMLFDDNGIIIRPDLAILYKKYSQWDFKAYNYGLIEPDYLHEIAKSSDLIPFFLLTTRIFYLPIRLFSDESWSDLYDECKQKKIQFMPDFGYNKYSKSHYEKLTQIYAQNVKSGNFAQDLFLNINHNNKLLNGNQKANFKLVYNGIGSIVKSAIVFGEIVIDSSLYYAVPQSEDEAYYLMGVLNAPIITELVTLMGSTGSNGSLRNIHKNPLENNFPEYTGEKVQIEIIKIAKKMESFVIDIIIDFLIGRLMKYNKNLKVCSKCGSIFDKNKYISHIKSCKIQKDHSLFKIVLESLNKTELQMIKQHKFIRKILRYSEIMEKDFSNSELLDKFIIIMKGILKPKTIQIKLQKNKNYIVLREELNRLVKKLISK